MNDPDISKRALNALHERFDGIVKYHNIPEDKFRFELNGNAIEAFSLEDSGNGEIEKYHCSISCHATGTDASRVCYRLKFISPSHTRTYEWRGSDIAVPKLLISMQDSSWHTSDIAHKLAIHQNGA